MTKTKTQKWQRFFMWIGILMVIVVFFTIAYQAGQQSVGTRTIQVRDPVKIEAPVENDSNERSRRRERDKDWDLNP